MRRNFALILIMGLGCSRSAPPAAQLKADAGPPITIVKPQQTSIKRVIEQPATLQPDEETRLHAKLPGFVRKVYVDIGHRVNGPKFDDKGREIKPGDLLAELTIPELEEESKQKLVQVQFAHAEVQQQHKAVTAAEANVASADSQIDEATAGLAKAQAVYDRWESEYKRVNQLMGSGVIDVQTRDEVQSQFKAADAARQEAKAKVASAEAAARKARADHGKAEADVKAAEAKLGVQEADARRVAALLSYAQIRAPFDGVVTVRRVNTGDLLSTGKPSVFSIARLDPIRAVVHVPEADAGLIKDGLDLTLSFPAKRGSVLKANVTRTSWALEPGSRTLRIEIDLPNADAQLRPGMFATAKMTTELPPTWTIPVTALVTGREVPSCFFVETGKAKRVELQIGHGDDQRVEVKKWRRSGSTETWVDITGSETIAIPGNKVSDGQTITSSATGEPK